jgi:phosphatidylserine/phosphatidylglycerophosphate/cardiolipin synthase-like enzyme
VSHLLNAADRDVRIRLLIDGSFLLGEDDLAIFLAEHPLIDYRVFNPYKRRMSGVFTCEVLNLGEFDRLNYRMHNKVMVVDNRVAIVGGRNLADEYFGLHPRSLRLNTEVGLLVESEAFNRRLREDLEPDFLGANAGNLQFDEAGKVVWVSDTLTASEQPAASCMQRVEDWFFAHRPIEEQM